MNTIDIRNQFISLYENDKFFVDKKTGTSMLEIIGASFRADSESILGEPSKWYQRAEVNWYLSESTNINDLYRDTTKIPAQWLAVADKHGEVNSNYGHLVFSKQYHEQHVRAVGELVANPGSRRAIMIYTRPSIWVEHNENGKDDFICTNAVSYYIRDKKIHCVVQMRSNDAVYGYKNDYHWQAQILKYFVIDYNEAATKLNASHEPVEEGEIHWQVQNLHVYARHFPLIEEAIGVRNLAT